MDQSELLKKFNNGFFDISDEFAPELKTHTNYVNLLKDLSEGLKLNYNPSIKSKINGLDLKDRIGLIKITNRYLDYEKELVEENSQFAQLASSWIAVKAYYLIYHLLTILNYLITADKNALNISHNVMHRWLIASIESKYLEFSEKSFNRVYLSDEVNTWRFQPGENLKTTNQNIEVRKNQLIKKIYKYKQEEYKRKEKIKRFTQRRKKLFEKVTKCALVETFYWYRIKSNYRDIEFLDVDISPIEFYNFYSAYYSLVKNFASCLSNTINTISEQRGLTVNLN